MSDPFHARAMLQSSSGRHTVYRLDALERAGVAGVASLPFTIKILLEAALRNLDGFAVTEAHVRAIAAWGSAKVAQAEIPFVPARVLLQDFTGVPAVVDLAAMRAAVHRLGGDPTQINPRVPVDLVVDHSVQVDAFGTLSALAVNGRREFERNGERYAFLRWGQKAFDQFRVVPPESGIVHQVNLEHLATVVHDRPTADGLVAFPDSLVGTDSHTTMVNGLGVLGWGVGGIEAEAVMLGQPLFMVMPPVVGLRLTGELPAGATATDLVLTVTQMLRKHGVVGRFVEFYGSGVGRLTLPDRATVANMAPEYGATMGFFPVDDEALRYLQLTGRGRRLDLVERYCKEQGLFRTDDGSEPRFTETLALDMSAVEPSVAGPRRPQDRVALRDTKRSFYTALRRDFGREAGLDPRLPAELRAWLDGDDDALPDAPGAVRRGTRAALYDAESQAVTVGEQECRLTHGTVVIAAITSCTNTSNPSVMLGAGVLARKAVERGLQRRPWVKTSLAPGSRVVTRYLERAGLMPYLQALGFHVVGYGCTTCIGNSGPVAPAVATAVTEGDLVVAAVLSGNRNFEGRINPLTRANYLASPPLVVAYAIAGTMDIDLRREPLGLDPNGTPVYLEDVWPTPEEIRDAVAGSVTPEMFEAEYERVFEGGPGWQAVPAPTGVLFSWQPDSTYIREPTFFHGLTAAEEPIAGVRAARALALLDDSVTTDHISPAGAIPPTSPAGRYLQERGVPPEHFNSYGSRRGNHELMIRGTFANIRLRNQLAPGTEGGFTTHVPSGEVTTIFEAAQRYQADGVPLLVLAGEEYGAGSSRDWAAKGTYLLGVQAVIAKTYERIHRSNLVGMGVLPLQFLPGQGWRELGLTGHELYDLDVDDDLAPGGRVSVTATAADGRALRFETVARVDSPVDVRYYRNGGILHTVLRDMVRAQRAEA